MREIWRKRSNLCYRDKELLRKRLELVLSYYDIRRHRGDLVWEREVMIKRSGGRMEKANLGELLNSARKYFSLDSNKKRKKDMVKMFTK